MSSAPIMQVQQVKKYFEVTRGFYGRPDIVKAVDDVTMEVLGGETFGLVGESGCGKSTLGRIILGLQRPTAGAVLFEGRDISKLSPNESQAMRREMQVIFQDPYASLNPRMTVGQIIAEPLAVHTKMSGRERENQVKELLTTVGLSDYHYSRYPHEFSGGQRQRIGIARALALRPKFIVCDEPVSALDVSIQSQIINLLEDLQEQFGLTLLFIAHDLSVVRHISDRVGVMYLGKLVEVASCDRLFGHPLHPYTQALLSAIPIPRPGASKRRLVLQGDLPSPYNLPAGCRFHTRCRVAQPGCSEAEPGLVEVEKGHYVSCLLNNRL